MYLYPDNLKGRATMWLWYLKDITVIIILALFSVVLFAQFMFFLPAIFTALYAFLTIRFDDTSILDFIVFAIDFFLIRQQMFEWEFTSKNDEPTRVVKKSSSKSKFIQLINK